MYATDEEIRLFRTEIKGKNFITPNIIYFKRINSFIVEVSEGTFIDEKVFGFTVLQIIENNLLKRRFDLDECFNDFNDVKKKEKHLEMLT